MDIFDKLMDVQEASEMWNLSQAQVKQHCASGNVEAKKFGNSWVIVKNQPNPKQREKRVNLKNEYDVIKEVYRKFVGDFFSDEPGTEKIELLPNMWAVINKNHDLHLSIECKSLGTFNPRTKLEDWFAVVTDVKTNEVSNFLLEFE